MRGRRSAGPSTSSAGWHQPRRPEGSARRRAAEGARELPQAGPHRVVRQLLQLLHLRTEVAGDRSSGPNRRVPLDQARGREVLRALMLKYRGMKLIRTGFIGVVLVVLVILVGLSPETVVIVGDVDSIPSVVRRRRRPRGGQRRDDLRNQGRQRLGGGAAGPQRARDVRPRRDSVDSGRTRPRTCEPERFSVNVCLTLESEGRRHDAPDGRHPGVAHGIAVLADRGGQRADDQHRRHRHRLPQPIAGHPVGDTGSGCATTGSDVRRGDPAVAGDQRPRRHAAASCSRTAPTSPRSCPSAANR